PESIPLTVCTRMVHVLSLALWFGSAVFFTFVVALSIFNSLESLGDRPAEQRPDWLPLSANFDRSAGTRLAGETIAPIFPRYFAIQTVSGLLAFGSAVAFMRWEPARRIHKIRFWLIALALLILALAWPLNQ